MGVVACNRCGKPALADERAEKPYCLECLVVLTDERMKEVAAAPPKAGALASPKAQRSAFFVVLCVTSIVVVWLNAGALRRSLEAKKPLRLGSYATDEPADLCISQLWKVVADLQQGRRGPWPSCPASQRPYRPICSGSVCAVSCPDPSAHRLSSLRATTEKPIPEIRL